MTTVTDLQPKTLTYKKLDLLERESVAALQVVSESTGCRDDDVWLHLQIQTLLHHVCKHTIIVLTWCKHTIIVLTWCKHTIIVLTWFSGRW